MSSDPVPFEIVVAEDGRKFGSNGTQLVALLDGDGRMFKRRGVKGLCRGTVADRVLPKLNEFAGLLLKNMEMPGEEIAARLQALAGMCTVEKPRPVETCVVELDGVRVYVDGANVVVTRQDLSP